MKPETKSLYIRTIINYLSEETKKKNAELVKRNLYTEQVAFDADDMFLKLAFMSDREVDKIASLILR